jgi:hypothetical protein
MPEATEPEKVANNVAEKIFIQYVRRLTRSGYYTTLTIPAFLGW